jgi:hypothetical protein
MTHTTRAMFVVLVCAVLAGPCWAQEGIPLPRFEPPPIRIGPPPVPVFPTHPVAGRGDDSGGPQPANPALAIGFIAGMVALVVLPVVFAAWMSRAVAHVRVVSTPPGEAPEEIRRAWVGVKLPLRRWETKPDLHLTEGVLYRQTSTMTSGYAVNGRAAVEALASHSPEAAAWWRTHAPHVVARGYRLWFPLDVCERVG